MSNDTRHHKPIEVHQVATMEELRAWARHMRTSVHLVGSDLHGNRVYAAHTERVSLVCKLPAEPRTVRDAYERRARDELDGVPVSLAARVLRRDFTT